MHPDPIFVGGDHDAKYIVAFNNVVTNHPNGMASSSPVGIFPSGPRAPKFLAIASISTARTRSNRTGAILVPQGVDVYGAVNNSLIAANVIQGSSAFGLDVAEGYYSTSTSNADQLLENDISGHTSLITDVYFGTNTSNLLFVGQCATHIDLGADNQIDCIAGSPLAHFLQRRAGLDGRGGDILRMSVHEAILDLIRRRGAK